MAQILTQDEVDALLKGVVGGEIETETELADEVEGEGPQSFDFGAQDKVIRGRMPTLDAINDRFARFFRNSLSSMLRRMVDVTPVSLDTIKFGNFMRSLAVPSSIHIVRMEPLRGNALVVLETKLVFALIDAFFGGVGGGAMKIEGREFTAIEQKMLYNVVAAALHELENAWQPVYELHFSYTRGEMNPQFAGIIPNEDVLIVVQFDIEMEEASGNIMVCIPYMLIEPIRDRLYSSFHTDEKQDVDLEWVNRFKHELMSVYVETAVTLGHTTISSRELSALRPGDVIMLEEDISDPLRINVQSLPKFLGRPGRLNDNMAVEVLGPIKKQLY